jgi:hypothetical protein
MPQSRLVQLVALALFLAAAGCGGNPVVVGRVTFVDGTPLGVGDVILDDGRNMGRGAIKPDGSFVIGFLKKGDGIPAGTYRVAIYNSDDATPGNWAVSSKYIDARTSGIVFEVQPGKRNVLNFQVEPNPSRRNK